MFIVTLNYVRPLHEVDQRLDNPIRYPGKTMLPNTLSPPDAECILQATSSSARRKTGILSRKSPTKSIPIVPELLNVQ